MAVRWGLLATAGIGAVMVDAARRTAEAEFVAVGSRSADKASAFAASHGLAHAYGSYEALVDSAEIDAVYVAVPVSQHFEWTIRALRAGKHVLCEKPFVQRPEQAAEAFDVAAEMDRFLAEAFMWRLHPQTAIVRGLIADGAIGRLRHIRAALTVRPGAVDIRRQRATGGGALFDLGAYCVSAARLFAGLPERVVAMGSYDGGEVDHRTVGLMWHADEVTSSFDVGFDMPRRDELELIGADGKIVVHDPWIGRGRAVELHREGVGRQDVPVDPDGDRGMRFDEPETYAIEIATVSRAIEAGSRTLEFARQDAIDQARTLCALETSRESSAPVVL